MLLLRDQFEDCTFTFEAHHHDYKRSRAGVAKYEVPEREVLAFEVLKRPTRGDNYNSYGDEAVCHHDVFLDKGKSPNLLNDESFDSVLRRRVAFHLRPVDHPVGSPKTYCVVLFWTIFIAWTLSYLWLYSTCSLLASLSFGYTSSLLRALGHNFVHQPLYRSWAKLSLDTIGFSSEAWFREHNLQHHMYTNTPWDNHYRGTDPFLTTDPTIERGLSQRYVTPCLNPISLIFGVYGNYIRISLGRNDERERNLSPR